MDSGLSHKFNRRDAPGAGPISYWQEPQSVFRYMRWGLH